MTDIFNPTQPIATLETDGFDAELLFIHKEPDYVTLLIRDKRFFAGQISLDVLCSLYRSPGDEFFFKNGFLIPFDEVAALGVILGQLQYRIGAKMREYREFQKKSRKTPPVKAEEKQ